MVAHRSTPRTLDDIPAAAEDRLSNVRAGGIAFGGFVALSFGDLSTRIVADSPDWVLDVFIVALVAAGIVLARTYVALSNCVRHVQALRVEDRNWTWEDAQAAYSKFEHRDPGDRVITFKDQTISGSAAFVADEYRLACIGYRTGLCLAVLSLIAFLAAAVWRLS